MVTKITDIYSETELLLNVFEEHMRTNQSISPEDILKKMDEERGVSINNIRLIKTQLTENELKWVDEMGDTKALSKILNRILMSYLLLDNSPYTFDGLTIRRVA